MEKQKFPKRNGNHEKNGNAEDSDLEGWYKRRLSGRK